MNLKYILIVFILATLLVGWGSVILFLLSSPLLDSVVNPPSTEASYFGAQGPSSWWMLFMYLSLPYFVLSIVYLVGVLHFLRERKQFILVALILLVVISALLFPKKVLYVNVPSPSETIRSVYTYSRGTIGYSDSADALFLTRLNIDQVVSFYESRLLFKDGELERLKEDVQRNPHAGDYESYELKNGTSLSIHIAYPDKDTYAVLFLKL